MFFVQIGSNIGKTPNDPLYPLITKGGWDGILVEPNPEAFEELKKNYAGYPFVFENIAIAKHNGKVPLFLFYEPFMEGISQIASLNCRHLHSHLLNGENRRLKEVIVPCLTLNSLFEKHNVTKVDILHIDAEGSDIDIIMNTDFSKVDIRRIMFEHVHTDGPFKTGPRFELCLEYLESFGYRVVNKGLQNIVLSK